MKNYRKLIFPSPYGVSFILTTIIYHTYYKPQIWFPSPYGVSFILTLHLPYRHPILRLVHGFPSPYGVSFILTIAVNHNLGVIDIKFPSPYGVSFILTSLLDAYGLSSYFISVSLWSIIHSYYFPNCFYSRFKPIFPSPYGVSFILTFVNFIINFSLNYISVSLWSIIHSYLTNLYTSGSLKKGKFPSPYGVSFILTLWSKKSFIAIYF